MPTVRQRVRRSARLQANGRTRPKAMELPPNPSTSRGRGKYRGRGSNPARNQPPKAAGPKIIVHWTRAQDLHCTDTLVTHLTTNPSDARTLFYEGKKTASSSTEDLRKLFRDHHDKFNKTGAGVTLLDKHAAANLHKQVLLEFPWYDQLHPFLFSNPTIGAKIFTSQPGVDHAADYYLLIRPHGGAGPSTNPPGPQLPQPDPQLPQLHPQNSQPPPPDPQPLPPDPQLPLWSPPDTSTQCAPPSIRPGPTGAQHALPSTLHPPPSQHPPPHFSGTGGSPINDPDGDLDNNPHADDNGPFFAPLGNTLGMLDGEDVDMDNDNGMELDSSRRHVISLHSPPRLVGQKRPYAASPSPSPVEKNTFLLPRKPQMPTYHSREAFGSASPGGQVPHKPSSLASSSGISRSHSTPSSTASSSFISTDYHVSPTASQTSLSAKPRSLASSKKKRASAADMEDNLNMLSEDIRSMQTDISECQESRNKRYAIKMNYQAQKKDLQ
ncbi:uncharacterized protein F5147DRAFT_655194 [Suillus discolor]|uniref:Uncharacterized protein n=1 Tax=Suillus discolor TaxID=1912936 RepID=A0A9P7F0V1_9AGAM|nr:uncharacterized protein F5147DRAFT_655194 [Suillus discolor]KAG2101881.1 hypothetical protein F5147DRAFT_655194 [Suillus discolor]